jgi:hypothetical protein
MHVTSITNNGDHVEVVYYEERDIDIDAGVVSTHTMRIADQAIDQELIDEIDQLGKQILDIGRRKRFGVADEFKAANR